jgi:hypothetical protein
MVAASRARSGKPEAALVMGNLGAIGSSGLKPTTRMPARTLRAGTLVARSSQLRLSCERDLTVRRARRLTSSSPAARAAGLLPATITWRVSKPAERCRQSTW